MAREGMLALDLATHCGWAFGAPGGEIVYGVSTFIDAGGLGAALHKFSCWLDLKMAQLQPARVVFESPILHANKTSVQTARRLMSMAGITEMIAAVWEQIEVYEEDSSTVTKWLTGKARWPEPPGFTGSEAQRREARRLAKKRKVIEGCQACGFTPKNDNEADALALFLYAEFKLDNVARLRVAA